MSLIIAPPIARIGEPKKLCKKRRTIKVAKLSTTAVIIEMIKKIPSVTIYSGLQPIASISKRRENSKGPIL